MVALAKRIALGCLVALAFFALIEGALWAVGVDTLQSRSDPYVGFAGFSPLFTERSTPSGQRVLETAPGKRRLFNVQRFPAQKAPGVTRIFCLGGSTTYGRPYNDQTSFCGWLRAFLPAVDPGKQWEVINAGGISYASYRVVRLMESLEPFDADLFVIYTGHNEYLEERTYGELKDTPEVVRDAASLGSRLRLYTLLSDAIVGPRENTLSAEVNTILDRSVGPEAYHRDEALTAGVLDHFRASLERMTGLAEADRADLIFVNPASNLADFSPFKSEPRMGLSSAKIAAIRESKRLADEQLEDDPAAAAAILDQALSIDPIDPDLLYRKGQALRALGRSDEARRAFIAARDQDVAPLRATSAIQSIVTDVAHSSAVGFVDYAALADAASPDGIPGAEQFLDHVHPTIDANRELALAIIREMIQKELVSPADSWTPEAVREISEQLVGSVDEAAHATALKNLSNVLMWAGKHEEAQRLVSQAVESGTDDAESYYQQAILLRREGRDEEALPLFQNAIRLAPSSADVRVGHGILLSDLGRKVEARQELELAVRLDANLPAAHYELGVVLGDLGDEAGAERSYRSALSLEPDHPDANNNLGVLLAMNGNLVAAVERFEHALRADPNHANARDNLAQARDLMR